MLLKISDFSFKSSNGVNTVRGIKVYDEETTPKGILQISHGMVEHYERYIDFASFLAEHGYVVYINDHLGHKHSVENDDQLGYAAPKNGHTFVLEDLYQTATIAKSEYPDIPLILLGHSMGSFYARYFGAVHGDIIDGLIISGTGNAGTRSKAGLVLCNIMGKLNGDKDRSEFIKKTAFGSYLAKIENPDTESDWITRDKDIVKQYVDDKYCQFNFTISGYRDLMNINILCNNDRTYKNTPNDMPVYIFSGSMDPVGNYGLGVMQVYDKYIKFGNKDTQVKIYDGGRHEMLNELNRQQVYADVLAWMDSKTGV